MSGIYKKNLKIIEKEKILGKEILAFLEQEDETENQIELRDGAPCIHREEGWFQLHSRKPKEEAKRLLDAVDPNREQLIFVLGMGNPELLEAVARKAHKASQIAVVEENKSIAKYVMSNYNMRNILSNKNVQFVIGREEEVIRMGGICAQNAWDNLIKCIAMVSLPYNRGITNRYLQRVKLVTQQLQNHLTMLGNSIQDSLEGLYNNYRNVDACIEANGISEVRGKFKGMPGIVVSAGPSLDKNIELLKQAEGKAVIMTTDAAYRACKRVGVTPDAIVSLERVIETYQYFFEKEQFPSETVLVGPTLLWPEIYETYTGKKIVITRIEGGAEGWWGSFFPQQEWIEMGLSCANTAHSMLIEMGCNPIILIGQDFAYTGHKQHSEDSKYLEDNDMKEQDWKNWKYWVEDIHGEMIPTSDTFNLFRDVMEGMIIDSDNEVIDATEGGAKIRGTQVMTFEEAIEKYCVREIPMHLNDCLEARDISREIYLEKYTEIIAGIDEILKDAEEILEHIAKHTKRLLELREKNIEEMSQKQLLDCMDTLWKGNEFVTLLLSEKRNLTTFYQQNLKQAVISIKELGNVLNAELVRGTLEVQGNFMHHMEITTRVLLAEYGKARKFILEKLEERQ